MSRTPILAILLVQGCIIYREDWDDDRPDCPTCTDPGTAPEPYGDDDDAPTEPSEPAEPPGPQVTADLALTEASAFPGDSILSSLVVVAGEVDLQSVEAVVFERDVDVLDTMVRPDEVVLLLAVAADASPGEVDVFVESTAGAGWILATPFTILEPEGTDPGCPQGGGLVDTACP